MDIDKSYKLDISIVIGENENFIIPCINSIYENNNTPVNINVIANLSSISIIKQIKRYFPQINMIMNDRKKSFAENHNNIIKKTKSKYILILNDDTIVKEKALDKMIEFMDNTPDAACISPKLINPDGSIQPVTYSFPTLFRMFLLFSSLRNLFPINSVTKLIVKSLIKKRGGSRFWDHNEICQVDTFKGACMMVRRKAIEEVGLMVEVAKFYGEETDWHFRFKEKGWKMYFFPKAEVIHYGSQSVNSPSYDSIRMIEMTKSTLDYFKKFHSKHQFQLLRIMLIIIFYIRIIVEYFKKTTGSTHPQKKIDMLKKALKIVTTLNLNLQ